MKELLSIASKSKPCQKIVVHAIFQSLITPVHSPNSTSTTTTSSTISTTTTSAVISGDNNAATWPAMEVLEYLTHQNPSLEYQFYCQLFVTCNPNLVLSVVNPNLANIIPYFIREIDGKLNSYVQNNGLGLGLGLVRFALKDRSGQDILLLLRLQWRLSVIENSDKIIPEMKLFLSDLLTNGANDPETADEIRQHRGTIHTYLYTYILTFMLSK